MSTDDAEGPLGASVVLHSIATLLGGERAERAVTGTLDGWPVSYEHENSDGPWTVIKVHVGGGFPLFVKLHRPWRGDVVEEDLTFKRAFAGAIAPLDIANRVFDREACDELVALGRELRLDAEGNRPFTLTLRGWQEDPAVATMLVRLMVSLAARAPEAQSAADAIAMAKGGMYRPELRDQTRAREREIEAAKEGLPKPFALPDVAPTSAVTAPFWFLTLVFDRMRRIFRRPR